MDDLVERREPPRPLRGARLAGLAVVCVATAAYGLTFWNRYLGVSVDGWFFHFGQELSRGVIPYRDYFFWTTPLHILEEALVGALFGPTVAAGHAVGVALRVVVLGVTYLWFTKRHAPALGVVVCVAVLVVGYDDNSEPLFYYTQQAILYAVLAGYLASQAFDRSGRAAQWRWIASGVAVGLALMTKHTLGAGALVPVALHALVADRVFPGRLASTGSTGRLARAGALGAVGIGAAIPIGGVFAWLLSKGAFGAFLLQVLVEAPAAKGPVAGTFTRLVTVMVAPGMFRWAGVMGLGCLGALLAMRAARRWLRASVRGPVMLAFVTTALTGAAVAVGIGTMPQGWPHPRLPQLAASALALWGCLLLTVVHGVRLARRPTDPDRWQRSLFACTSFFLAYALSLSWGLYEQMVLPGLACVLGELGGEHDEDGGDREPLAQWCVVAFCLLVTSTGAACKRYLPYDWSLWREPPLWEPRASSVLPELRGMALSAITVQNLDQLTADITRNSEPDEKVFVYPYLPLLYELAHRRPSTFAQVHWFDVTPDDVATADAHRLLRDPPRVIVTTRFPEAYYRAHEVMFRGGQPSGQRDIEGAIEVLSPRYDVVDEIKLPYTKLPITVLKRRD